MFWTDVLVQRTLFGEDEYCSSSTISQLICFSQQAFPSADCNLHRQVAFLTHQATQNFLAPMLLRRFGSLAEAKIPTLRWLDEVGSFETFARSTRKQECESRPARLANTTFPDWYRRYLKTDRFAEMKRRAFEAWNEQMSGITCCTNSRHPFEVMHHRDYSRLGEADEFRYLVPLCHSCHCTLGCKGPSLQGVVPEAVKKWL